jgi:hypothetical protein
MALPDAPNVEIACLRRACTLAGGVSNLARRLALNPITVDNMLWGRLAVPPWVFLRAADFINEAEASGLVPPGFPADWEDWERIPRSH